MCEESTNQVEDVMYLAYQEAARRNHEYIGTEHILLGLMIEGSGVAAIVLKKLGVERGRVSAEIEKLVKIGPEGLTENEFPTTPRTKKVYGFAVEEARVLGDGRVGTEHLLLGLVRVRDGVAAQVLMNLGLELEKVRDEVLRLLRMFRLRRDEPLIFKEGVSAWTM